jgi:hypothetical protein
VVADEVAWRANSVTTGETGGSDRYGASWSGLRPVVEEGVEAETEGGTTAVAA